MGDRHTRTGPGIVENLAVDALLGTSYIDWCICGCLSAEGNIVAIHARPVAILTLQSKVMLLLEEEVREDAMAYGLGSLRYFLCCVARLLTVQMCTQAFITVSFQAAGIWLIESGRDLVEKHEWMIGRGRLTSSRVDPSRLHSKHLGQVDFLYRTYGRQVRVNISRTHWAASRRKAKS